MARLCEILLPWGSQPQEAVDVRPALNPITGLQPGMGRLVDTSGNPLTSVGSGITESVGPFGKEVDFGGAGRLTRVASVSGHPLSFVFAGRVDGSGLQCLSSIASSADKLARVFGFDGNIYAQHIGATTNAAAQSGLVWNYGTYWAGVAVFRSPTDVSVYAQGNVGRSSAKTTTNVGALGTLTKITYGAYDGSSPLYNLDGSIALAQWLGVALTADEAWALVDQVWSVFAPRTIWVPVSAGGGTSALTGTATTATETDIVTGGKTIILTLTGDTWVASGGTFDAIRQDIIDGVDSDLSEATGWDAEVKAKQGVSGVVRTSDTVVTITLDAQAAYDITATETITATIPASALTLASPIVASPAFQVTAASGFQAAWARGSNTVLQVGL